MRMEIEWNHFYSKDIELRIDEGFFASVKHLTWIIDT